MSRAFLGVVTVAALWPAASCGLLRPRSARGYNLLLLTLDTVRGDRLGCYGYAAAETPALDALAREGARFETAAAAVPLTLPSHATLLSGWLPLRHGLRNNGAGRFPQGLETLATRLSARGYRTAAFLGAFVLDRRFGLARGFDHYDDEIERDPGKEGGLGAERAGAQVVDRALAWLGRQDRREGHPFFAWVHLYDAHAPYEPPEPYRSRHAGQPYDGEIAYVDSQVARLVEALRQGGEAGRTVVAVVGDHGEALGEHGELTHGLLVYEASLRVPFLVRAPGALAAGRVVRTPVGLADVGPTLAGLLELPMGAGLDGRDLSGALRGRVEPPPADLYAESEYPRTFGWSGLAALRRGRLKYVAAPTPELYDLEGDPREQVNLAGRDPRAGEIETRLAEMRRGAAPTAAPERADADARERLAALGYVAAGPAPSAGGAGARGLRDPKDVVGLFRRFEEANWAIQGGRLVEATATLEELVAADPPNAVFRMLLAQAWRRRGRRGRAIELYRQAVAAAPDDSDARYNLAVTLQEAGRHAEALAAIEEALRRDPARPEAHNALGIALFAAGRPAEALAEFDRATELDPRDARAHNNRGNVLRQIGRLGEAAPAYRRAIELAPRYADPLNGLGALEVQRDRPAEGLLCFDRALALAPELHEARLNRAIALEMMKEYPKAIEAYRDFLTAARNDPAFSEQRKAALQLLTRLSAGPAR